MIPFLITWLKAYRAPLAFYLRWFGKIDLLMALNGHQIPPRQKMSPVYEKDGACTDDPRPNLTLFYKVIIAPVADLLKGVRDHHCS